MKVYGPYKRKQDGRWIVIHYIDGVCVTQSYPRFIMEAHLGRKLLDSEDVHHKDENVSNNSIDNLEVKPQGKHLSDHYKNKVTDSNTWIEFKCPECDKPFQILLKDYKNNQVAQKKAGPFCSRRCAGKRNQRI